MTVDRLSFDASPRARQENVEPKTASANPALGSLKERLHTFWSSHQDYWDMTASNQFVEAAPRQRATSYVPTGGSVLDVACGTAANSVWLKDECRYFGVDVSVKALQQPIHPSLQLACGDAEDLPFRPESFDAIVSTYVLEHAVEPIKTLQEMCRVAKPKGRIILLGPAWDFPFWFPNSLRSKAGNPRWRLRYTLGRFWRQLMGWWLGQLPFERVNEPDAFYSEFICDADAVYIVWTYEVVRLMKRWGYKLLHWEVDDRMLGTNAVVRTFKRLLSWLPIYRYAGSTVLLVFEK